MNESVKRFYDDLAAEYHCVYADWESAIERQSAALDRLIGRGSSAGDPVVLDCSCGTGTQAIGLAQRGYELFASDLSPKAVARAESEAARPSGGWRVKEIRTRYRALRRQELDSALEAAGFAGIAWHAPEQSGYHQPIVTARSDDMAGRG